MNDLEDAPIFVVGTGRSGSTVFFDMFSMHPNVAWPSELSHRYPDHAWMNTLLMRLRANPLVDTLLGRKYGPSEAYPFWERNCPGFTNPYRDLLAEDVTPTAASSIRHAVSGTVNRWRHRFIAKITGWPRIRYLRQIFPDALFIEVSRDPCAIASSLLNVAFWDGWRGPPTWRRGPLPPDLDSIWRQEGESFVALAAIEYVIVQRALTECRAGLPPWQIHDVSYSRLCTDPVGVFREVVAFAGLQWSPRFERAVARTRLVNRDDLWRSSLTSAQQAALERTLERAHYPRA
jgi:hypothetical protein